MVNYHDPPFTPHVSHLLPGAALPPPVLAPEDFAFREPRLSRGVSVTDLGGEVAWASHQRYQITNPEYLHSLRNNLPPGLGGRPGPHAGSYGAPPGYGGHPRGGYGGGGGGYGYGGGAPTRPWASDRAVPARTHMRFAADSDPRAQSGAPPPPPARFSFAQGGAPPPPSHYPGYPPPPPGHGPPPMYPPPPMYGQPPPQHGAPLTGRAPLSSSSRVHSWGSAEPAPKRMMPPRAAQGGPPPPLYGMPPPPHAFPSGPGSYGASYPPPGYDPRAMPRPPPGHGMPPPPAQGGRFRFGGPQPPPQQPPLQQQPQPPRAFAPPPASALASLRAQLASTLQDAGRLPPSAGDGGSAPWRR